MKTPKNLLIFLVLWMATTLTAPLVFSAQKDALPPSHDEILKSLLINRSMRTESEITLAKLIHQLKDNNSDRLKQNLVDTQFKIKALLDEAEQMKSWLSVDEQADEFMNDVLLQKSIEQFSKHLKNPEESPIPNPSTPQSSDATPADSKLEALQEELNTLHERALKFVATRQLDKAVKLYEEIVLRDPNDDEAYVILGHTYLMMEEYEKAENAFQNAIHLDADNVNEIIPFYQNMILQNPEDEDAYNNLGYAYLILGDEAKARDAFENALDINPQSRRALEGMNADQ